MVLVSWLSEIEPINFQLFPKGVMYRCEARSREAFIQQVAVSYVLNGYFFMWSAEFLKGRQPIWLTRN